MERLSVGLRDHGGLFRQDGPGLNTCNHHHFGLPVITVVKAAQEPV